MQVTASIDEVRAAYLEHGPYLHRAARYLGVAPADVDDVVHEVFLVAHRRWHELDRGGNRRTLLYGICMRVASAHRRRAHRRYEVSMPEVPERPADGDGERSLEAARDRARLLAALDQLDDDKRVAVVLFDVEEQPMEAVAEAMGVPLKTAYSRLYAGRRRLREVLALEEKS